MQGGFYPQVIERALDRIVYQTQQIAEKLGRAITLSASSALSGLFLPDPESGKFLRGRADGTGYENADVTAGGSIGIPVAILQGGTGRTTLAAHAADVATQLGLGTAATVNVGVAAGNVVQLDGNAKYPAANGSQIIGLLTGMKNRVINGGMDIAQRAFGATAPANAIIVMDRWRFTFVTTAIASIGQQPDAPPSNEFQSSHRITVTTTDAAVAAGDHMEVSQAIEGWNVRDLIGAPFTLSFWVRSAKTGAHCVAFRNIGLDRTYVAEYTVATVDTWQKVSVTVPAGLITAGTWNWGISTGLLVTWTLMAGTIIQTTPNAWQTGNFIGTVNQVNVCDLVGNIFAITGVQLEAGSSATPFEHRPYALELMLCQRYYEKSCQPNTLPGTVDSVGAVEFTSRGADQNDRIPVSFKVTKRAAPTISVWSTATGNGLKFFNVTGSADIAAGSQDPGPSGFTALPTANTTSASRYAFQWAADAEF